MLCQLVCCTSPRTRLTVINTAPAASICHVALTDPETPAALYFEYNEPPDPAIDPNTSKPIPHILACTPGTLNAFNICSPNSKITPPKPISRPAIVHLLLKFSFHLG